jgi:hypothetical protein
VDSCSPVAPPTFEKKDAVQYQQTRAMVTISFIGILIMLAMKLNVDCMQPDEPPKKMTRKIRADRFQVANTSKA